MNTTTFDRLLADAARRPARRTVVRLLAGAFLGTLLPARTARADHSDVDGDQLWDEDEVDIYGTNPQVFDTDGDGVGDGEEIWNRDQGLGGPSDPLTPAGAAPAPAPTCSGLGGACAQFGDCCAGEYVQCCFNASGAGMCQDVSQTGFVCTGWADVPATGCPVGYTNCGGFCTNLSIDHGNCGACGHRCPFGTNCTVGACV